MNKTFTYNDFDREFWNRELEDFVPQKIYDMHTHLWTEGGQEHLPPADCERSSEKRRMWSTEMNPLFSSCF